MSFLLFVNLIKNQNHLIDTYIIKNEEAAVRWFDYATDSLPEPAHQKDDISETNDGDWRQIYSADACSLAWWVHCVGDIGGAHSHPVGTIGGGSGPD